MKNIKKFIEYNENLNVNFPSKNIIERDDYEYAISGFVSPIITHQNKIIEFIKQKESKVFKYNVDKEYPRITIDFYQENSDELGFIEIWNGQNSYYVCEIINDKYTDEQKYVFYKFNFNELMKYLQYNF